MPTRKQPSQPPARISPLVRLGEIEHAHWVATGLWVAAGALRFMGPRPDWLAFGCLGMAVLVVMFLRHNPTPENVPVPDDMRDRAEEYRQAYVRQIRGGRGFLLTLGAFFVLTGAYQFITTNRN